MITPATSHLIKILNILQNKKRLPNNNGLLRLKEETSRNSLAEAVDIDRKLRISAFELTEFSSHVQLF